MTSETSRLSPCLASISLSCWINQAAQCINLSFAAIYQFDGNQIGIDVNPLKSDEWLFLAKATSGDKHGGREIGVEGAEGVWCV